MSETVYLKIDEFGFVIGGYHDKLIACHTVLNDKNVKLIKVTYSYDNILTEEEAIKTIQEEVNKRT